MAKSNNEPSAPMNAALSISKVVVYIMYVVVAFAEIVLLFRVFFLLFSANAGTPFVNFVYETSGQFLAPFRGIFPPHAAELTGGYLDVSALFAAIVYLIILVLVQNLMAYLESHSTR